MQSYNNDGWSAISNTLYFQTQAEDEISVSINSYSATPTEVTVGEDVILSFSFTNTGDIPWTFYAALSLRRPDNSVDNSPSLKPITLSPGQSGTAEWTYVVDMAGNWDVVFGVWTESSQVTSLGHTGWLNDYITITSSSNLYQLPATSGRISYFASDDGHPGQCNPAAWGELLGENCGTDDATKYWYCAMRWPYVNAPESIRGDVKEWWHDKKIIVTNPENSKQVVLAAKDWGPAEWTGRVIDVSLTALNYLDAVTDDTVNIGFADQNALLGYVSSGAYYPSAKWNPANTNCYTPDDRKNTNDITYIIIHTAEGSLQNAINTFQNPDSGVSAHYIVSKTGEIIAMVYDRDIAHHAGNWEYNKHSIGIEHEGYVNDPNSYTEAMYQASANLVRWLVQKYNIQVIHPVEIAPSSPTTSTGIIGHDQVPDPNDPNQGGGINHHTDPGEYWDWDYYISLVAEAQESSPFVTSSLEITQSSPYYLWDTVTAQFTIENKGTAPITFDVLTVGGRDPDYQVADFTYKYDITLNPSESYMYQGSLTLTKAGDYHFFCAYKTPDGNWNTAIPTEDGGSNVLDITSATYTDEEKPFEIPGLKEIHEIPGFEIIIVICALVLVLFLRRKNRF
jgi:N-acetyl-anhydromuramyl-L-alanine amidase AmpD/predicted secreted protein